MMIDTTEFNILVWVRMTVTFTEGHKPTRNWELVQLFCCKMAWSSENFRKLDFMRELTGKKSCKYLQM